MVVVSTENGRKAVDRASPPLPFVFFPNSLPYMAFRRQPWVQVGSSGDVLPIGGRGVAGQIWPFSFLVVKTHIGDHRSWRFVAKMGQLWRRDGVGMPW